MNFDITASDSASREFLAVAAAAEKLEDKLKKLDKMTAEPTVDLNIDPANRKLDQLKTRLDALKNVRTKVELDGADQARRDVTGLVVELRKLRDTKVNLDLATGTARKDIQQISSDLKSLRDAKVKVDVSVSGEDKITRLKLAIDELKRESPIKIRIEAEGTSALAALAGVRAATKNAAKDINGTKAAFRPTADASKVTSALGAIRAAVAAASDDITKQHPQFRASADASQILATLKKVESAVQSTAAKIFATKPHMQATADVAPMLSALRSAQSAVSAVVDNINGKKPTLKANADVDGVLSAVAEVEAALSALPNERTVNVKVKTDNDGMSRLAKIGLALAALSPLAVAAGGASTAAIASLGGAIATTVPIAVAGLGMLGGVLATVEVATNGVGAAFAAFRENDMKKFQQLLGELSPNARAFTLELTDLYVQLKRASGAVQDRMFAGLAQSLHQLGAVEVPLLKRGMGGVADELNVAARSVMGYLSSAEGVARQTSMWVSTRQVVGNLRPAFTDVVAILSDLGEVGGKVLADVTDGVGGVTARWREWIAEARNSGKLEDIMRGGVEVFAKLGSIIGNTGSILASFYRAATAAGSDFLSSLDRGTEAAARFLKSAEGQSSLTTFFRESRAAIDALMPGLAALGRGAMEAIKAFGETGGLSRFGAVVGEILTQVGAVLGPLGTLAGGVLKAVAAGAATAAQALGPIVAGLLNLVNAAGPVGPTIIAMVLAFKGLQGVSVAVAGAGVALSGFARDAGLGVSASTRIAGAFSKVGAAIPLLGAAVVALGVAYQELGSKADESARRVLDGSSSMQQAVAAEVAQIERQRAAVQALGGGISALLPGFGGIINSLGQWALGGDAAATATDRVNAAVREAYNALSPYEKVSADVAMAQRALNDAIVQFGQGTPQAAAAADALRAALDRKKAADEGATTAAKSHAEAMRDQVNAAQQLLGSMLSVEDALARVEEAEKAANDEVSKSGAESAKAKAALNDHSQAALQAAQSIGQLAGQQAEAQAAGTGAAAESRAYGAALLTLAANAKGPAQEALKGHLAQLSQAQLDAMSAGAAATGFGTQIMELPGGKTVKIAVDPETGKIVSTQQLLDAMQKNPVMIRIGADTLPADQAFQRVLADVQAGRPSVTIDGQNMPALDALRAVGQQAGLENATVNIGGQSMPAQAVLSAFITSVQTGNPMVNINGQDFDARAVFAALQSTITAPGTNVPIGATTAAAEERINWLKGLIAQADANKPVGADVSPAQVRLVDLVNEAQRPATKPIEGNPAGGNAAAAQVHQNASNPATKPMGGDPTGANATNAGITSAVQAPATKPMQGNPADANAKNSAVNAAVQQQATKPIGANPGPAQGPIAAVHALASKAQSFTVNATRHPALQGAINGILAMIPGSRSIVITITRIFQTIGNMFENGGILPMASGGVVAQTRAYDSGGADDPRRNQPGKTYDGHRLTPMSSGRAAEVAPRTYRVIGDRQRDTEVFIPLNGSRSSLAFTQYAANQQGYALAPLKDRSGGRTMAMASGGVAPGYYKEANIPQDHEFVTRNSAGQATATLNADRIQAEDGSYVSSSFYGGSSSFSGSMPITFRMASGGVVAPGYYRAPDVRPEHEYVIRDAAGRAVATVDDESKAAEADRKRLGLPVPHGDWIRATNTKPKYVAARAGMTTPLTSGAGMASQIRAAQSQIRTAPGGGGGIDLSALIGEVRAVKAAVLATGPNNADVVAAVGRVERSLTARGNVAVTAQGRRTDAELSRI